MPKKLSQADAKELFNFYFGTLEKYEFYGKLKAMNLERSAAATIRALIKLFVNGQIDESKLLSEIDNQTLFTPSGRPSKL